MVLLGAPGVGKGTQAKLIEGYLGIPHVSTGDIFRSHIRQGTSLGAQIEEYLRRGQLVPDELTISIVKERVSMEDCCNGFLLDGFPRSLRQANYLDSMFHESKKSLDKVIFIDLPEDIIIDRISGRRFCSGCNASFHIRYNPPKQESRCDSCGELLVQRADDDGEVVAARLRTYYETTKPLIDYYNNLGILYKVQGGDSIEDVFSSIRSVLETA